MPHGKYPRGQEVLSSDVLRASQRKTEETRNNAGVVKGASHVSRTADPTDPTFNIASNRPHVKCKTLVQSADASNESEKKKA